MPSHTTFVVKASSGKLEVARTYVLLGIQHILLGVDHLLFVLALLIIVRGGRRILLTITAFTVAHSITLVAATLGWLALPGRARGGHDRAEHRLPRPRNRYVVARPRGAHRAHAVARCVRLRPAARPGVRRALAEIGLPPNSIPVAFLCFNVGVEIGQLLFVGTMLGLAWSARVWLARWRQTLRWVAPYVIGSVATFWVIERVVAFWN